MSGDVNSINPVHSNSGDIRTAFVVPSRYVNIQLNMYILSWLLPCGEDGRRGWRAGKEGLRGEELTSGMGNAKNQIEEWGEHPWGVSAVVQ